MIWWFLVGWIVGIVIGGLIVYFLLSRILNDPKFWGGSIL